MLHIPVKYVYKMPNKELCEWQTAFCNDFNKEANKLQMWHETQEAFKGYSDFIGKKEKNKLSIFVSDADFVSATGQ